MANPQLPVLRTKVLTVVFHDGPPDANGNPTGNVVIPASNAIFTCVPAADVGFVQTSPTTANVTGQGPAQTGVVLTVKDPASAFTKSLTIDVVPGVILSASLVMA